MNLDVELEQQSSLQTFIYGASTGEAEAGGSQVQGQLGVHTKTI